MVKIMDTILRDAHQSQAATRMRIEDMIPALEKLRARLDIPVVYNSSGYEYADTVKMLDGLIDVYLPDFKYAGRELAEKYSSAPDYASIAVEAIREMCRQRGKAGADEICGFFVNALRLLRAGKRFIITTGIIHTLFLRSFYRICSPIIRCPPFPHNRQKFRRAAISGTAEKLSYFWARRAFCRNVTEAAADTRFSPSRAGRHNPRRTSRHRN